MTTSQAPFLSEIADLLAPIPPGKLAYFESRVRHAFHDYILGKFQEKQKLGLTKAALAKRIGRDPGLVTRYLATPNNLTLDTATILLLGIAAEELQPDSVSVLNRAPRNFDPYAIPSAATSAPTPISSPPISASQGSSWVNENFNPLSINPLSAS